MLALVVRKPVSLDPSGQERGGYETGYGQCVGSYSRRCRRVLGNTHARIRTRLCLRMLSGEPKWTDLIPVSICDTYSVSASIRPICTRCCFTMTDTIQVCSNFHRDRVFITNTRPDATFAGGWPDSLRPKAFSIAQPEPSSSPPPKPVSLTHPSRQPSRASPP